MGRSHHAIVVGGGIIGVTSAYALARDGWRVTLIERDATAGQGASLGNGRQLSYSHTNALASPQLLRRIPALLAGCDPAFRMRLRSDAGFWHWTVRFLANCTSAAHRRNTLDCLALAERSRDAMTRVLAEEELEFSHRTPGKLVLLEDERDVIAAHASLNSKRATGLRQEMLSPAEAVAVEPALARVEDRLRGVLHAPDDETGDCAQFAQALLARSIVSHGVTFCSGQVVRSVARVSDETIVDLEDGTTLTCDLAVIANGQAANILLAPLGHRLPIEPMKGYSFTAPLGNAAPLASVTDHKRRLVFTHLGDRMLVAGIAEMGRVDTGVDPVRLEFMIASARASLPEAAVYTEVDSGWAGLRPMTPNSLPLVRMLERGIAVNAGHGMLGWTLAMGSAEQLRDTIRAAA